MDLWLRLKQILVTLLIMGLVLLLLYFIFIRPWVLRAGATESEVEKVLRSDKLIAKPGLNYTQAITINAPAEIVWKYLVQVGYQRAGWYNWDFINRLSADDYFYEGDKSAERIIPELQNLQLGEKIYLNPALALIVTELKENDTFLLTVEDKGKNIVSWVFKLNKINDTQTRVLVRWRSNLGNNIGLKLANLLIIEPGGVGIQQRQMLKGIKERSEVEFKTLK